MQRAYVVGVPPQHLRCVVMTVCHNGQTVIFCDHTKHTIKVARQRNRKSLVEGTLRIALVSQRQIPGVLMGAYLLRQ